jgi:predicted RNase H-like HicB family nuclease
MRVPHYHVEYEETATGWSAYVPDLPGCVSSSKTRRGIERLIREAIVFHLEGLAEDGVEPPVPSNGIVANLRAKRIELGVTQSEMARRLGISQTHISVLENGVKIPSIERVEAYAAALGLQLSLQ